MKYNLLKFGEKYLQKVLTNFFHNHKIIIRILVISLLFFNFFGCSNKVEEKYPNGKIKSTGDKINNKMEGMWTFLWENGNLKAEGKFINGDGGNIGSIGIPINGRDSLWKTYYENNKLETEQYYKNGKRISYFLYKENGDEVGELLEISGNELYFTKRITKDFAEKFGDYLKNLGWFTKLEDSSGKSASIDKLGGTFRLSICAKEGIENDPENINALKFMTIALSNGFFNRQPVDIAIVDNNFKTIRVIPFQGK